MSSGPPQLRNALESRPDPSTSAPPAFASLSVAERPPPVPFSLQGLSEDRKAGDDLRSIMPMDSFSCGETATRFTISTAADTARGEESEWRQRAGTVQSSLPSIGRTARSAEAFSANVPADADAVLTPLSSVLSTIGSVDDGGEAVPSLASTPPTSSSPAQNIWTRHLSIPPHGFSPLPPPFRTAAPHPTGNGGGIHDHDDALSEGAAVMIAQALHRSSLLQQCLSQWQWHADVHSQWRRHREMFAEGYYQRNLLYLFFRAWQWRHNERGRRTTQQHRVKAFRRRRLLSCVFSAWRSWRSARTAARRLASATEHQHALLLLHRGFRRWQESARLRSLAKGLAIQSEKRHRTLRYGHWRQVLFQRQRCRLLTCVVALHTPTAWGKVVVTPTRKGCMPSLMTTFSQLQLRALWMQWLGVTAQRRARRLVRFESVVATLTQRTTATHRHSRYTRWLQVTFASLQARQRCLATLRCAFQEWGCLGFLKARALRWQLEHAAQAKRHCCFRQWRTRWNLRQTLHDGRRRADLFFHSVIQAHAVRVAWQHWLRRLGLRQKARRMRRVAESYARPALLRHLFVRHIADSVLGSAMGVVSDAHQPIAPPLPTVEPTRQTSGGPATVDGALLPPIPLPLVSHRHALRVEAPRTDPLSVPALPARAVQTRSAGDCPAPDAAALSDTEVAEPLAFSQPPTPPRLSRPPSPPPPCRTPPPTYAEVMGTHRLTVSGMRSTPSAPPARCDIGVGTIAGPPMQPPLARNAPHHGASPGEMPAAAADTAPSPGFGHAGQGLSPAMASNPPLASLYAYLPCGYPPPLPPYWGAAPWPPSNMFATATPISLAPIATAVSGASSVPVSPRCLPLNDAVAPALMNASCLEASVPSKLCTHPPCSEAVRQFNPLPKQAPSPPTHYGFDIHHHVDPLAPLPNFPSTSAPSSEAGVSFQPTAGGGRSHMPLLPQQFQEGCTSLSLADETPGATSLGRHSRHRTATIDRSALARGRMPLNFIGCSLTRAEQREPISSERGVRGANKLHGDPFVSPKAPICPQGPNEGSSIPFPTSALPVGDDDKALFHAQARETLEDYKKRNRLIAAERAELMAVASQLSLLAQGAGGDGTATLLAQRYRHLQRRVLEWKQQRAKVAQLAVWLEGQVSRIASSAASQGGDETF